MTEMSELYLRCDPLSFSPWWLLMRSILQADTPERALTRIDDGIRTLGPSPWTSYKRMLALLAAGRFEEASEEGRRIPPGTDYVGPGRITLPLAAAGRLEEARAALAEDIATYGADNIFMMASYAAVGDRASANRIAAMLDARLDGAWAVLGIAQTCYCGAPFDLDATPNLRARLEEAGLPWPPRTVIHFPAKDG